MKNITNLHPTTMRPNFTSIIQPTFVISLHKEEKQADVPTDIPTYTHYRVGYRAFLIQQNLLCSLVIKNCFWPIRKEMEAVCFYHIHDKQIEIPPNLYCGCGIYAFDSLGLLLGNIEEKSAIICKVALWGKVIRTEFGCRAQYAYPLSVIGTLCFHHRECTRVVPAKDKDIGWLASKYGICLEPEIIPKKQLCKHKRFHFIPKIQSLELYISMGLLFSVLGLLLLSLDYANIVPTWSPLISIIPLLLLTYNYYKNNT